MKGWARLVLHNEAREELYRFDSPFVPRVGESIAAGAHWWTVKSVDWTIPVTGSVSHRDGEGPLVQLVVEMEATE